MPQTRCLLHITRHLFVDLSCLLVVADHQVTDTELVEGFNVGREFLHQLRSGQHRSLQVPCVQLSMSSGFSHSGYPAHHPSTSYGVKRSLHYTRVVSRVRFRAAFWAGLGLRCVKMFRACVENFFEVTDTFVVSYCYSNLLDYIFNKQ